MDEPKGPSLTDPAETSYAATQLESSRPSVPALIRPMGGRADETALRAAWNLLLYAAMAGVLYLFFLGPALYWAREYLNNRLLLTLLAELGLIVVAWVPAFVMAAIEGVDFASYGLPLTGALGRFFWVGLLWGFAAITGLLFAMRGFGVFSFGHLVLHGMRIWKFASFWAALFLCVGLFEEFLTRGYSQRKLSQVVGFWPGALLLSAAFVWMHVSNPGESTLGLLAVGCIGLFFCLTLRRTGTLWFAVGFHTSWDWGQSFLYSVPDSGTLAQGHLLSASIRGAPWLSGGTVGPEGSVLVFLVIALVWIGFTLTYPRVAL